MYFSRGIIKTLDHLTLAKNHKPIDRNFISKYSNNSVNSGPMSNKSPAFIKNK